MLLIAQDLVVCDDICLEIKSSGQDKAMPPMHFRYWLNTGFLDCSQSHTTVFTDVNELNINHFVQLPAEQSRDVLQMRQADSFLKLVKAPDGLKSPSDVGGVIRLKVSNFLKN